MSAFQNYTENQILLPDVNQQVPPAIFKTNAFDRKFATLAETDTLIILRKNIDPGILLYLQAIGAMPQRFDQLVVRDSGHSTHIALGGSLRKLDSTNFHTQRKGPRYEVTHNVELSKNSIVHDVYKKENIKINSCHSTQISKLGKGLKVTMRAKDGGIEAIEKENHPFFLGIQFHAELRDSFDKEAQKLFKRFIKESKK